MAFSLVLLYFEFFLLFLYRSYPELFLSLPPFLFSQPFRVLYLFRVIEQGSGSFLNPGIISFLYFFFLLFNKGWTKSYFPTTRAWENSFGKRKKKNHTTLSEYIRGRRLRDTEALFFMNLNGFLFVEKNVAKGNIVKDRRWNTRHTLYKTVK